MNYSGVVSQIQQAWKKYSGGGIPAAAPCNAFFRTLRGPASVPETAARVNLLNRHELVHAHTHAHRPVHRPLPRLLQPVCHILF
jgi:hypothetical protein